MMERRLKILLALFVLSITSCGSVSQPLENPPPSQGKLDVKEISLGPVGQSLADITISPDQRRVAYKVERGDKEAFVVDGQEGPAYDKVKSLHFSPDSKRVAYSARRDGQQFIVVDGVEQCIVIDGKEGPLFDRADSMRISPDGKQIAYTASRGMKTVTICDGKEIAKGAVLFSPDWQHQAYLTTRGLFGGSWTIVRDGKEGLQHNVGEPWRTHLSFSPDSQRLAYWSSENRNVEFVVVDGIQSIRYHRVEVGDEIFSPDSKHVAYWATPASGKWHIFVDGSYSDAYDAPLHGSKLVFDGLDTLHALAVRGGEILRVEIRAKSARASDAPCDKERDAP